MRAAAVAGSMALTMSLALGTHAAMAQGSPEETIQGFMDAVAAKDFEALPGYFCLAEAAQAAEFDVSALAGEMPEGMDVQSLLDAFIFDISLDSVERRQRERHRGGRPRRGQHGHGSQRGGPGPLRRDHHRDERHGGR